jgi:phage virion morphogenesis protein
MAEGFEGLEKLLNRLGALALDTKRVEKPLKAAGAYMLESIEKNFQQQGRPKRWDPLSPRTLAGRRRGRRKKGGLKILIDTARLKNSMSVKLVEGPAVAVGTNVKYARRQHAGYDSEDKSRGHSRTPARAFLMFQDEDYDRIGEIFKRHITRQ